MRPLRLPETIRTLRPRPAVSSFFTFSQIIDPRRLLLDGLRLLGKLFAKRLRLPDGKTQRHDLLRDGQLLRLILDGQQRPRVTGGSGNRP